MATEVSRAPQSQNLTNRRSWMVQPCIRLLAGRFRVQILVAEPSRWRQLRHCFEAAQACAPVGRAHRSIRVDKPQVAAAQVYVAVSDSPVEGQGEAFEPRRYLRDQIVLSTLPALWLRQSLPALVDSFGEAL